MAYAATVTATRLSERDILIRVAETEVAAASEATISPSNVDLPQRFRLLRAVSVLSAGTAATIDPILGRSTNPSNVDVIYENAAPAATADNAPIAGLPVYLGNSYPYSMFHRSRPNAGADNTVTTEYYIREGWGQD